MGNRQFFPALTSLFALACCLATLTYLITLNAGITGAYYPQVLLVYAPLLYGINRLFLRKERSMLSITALNGGLWIALVASICILEWDSRIAAPGVRRYLHPDRHGPGRLPGRGGHPTAGTDCNPGYNGSAFGALHQLSGRHGGKLPVGPSHRRGLRRRRTGPDRQPNGTPHGRPGMGLSRRRLPADYSAGPATGGRSRRAGGTGPGNPLDPAGQWRHLCMEAPLAISAVLVLPYPRRGEWRAAGHGPGVCPARMAAGGPRVRRIRWFWSCL